MKDRDAAIWLLGFVDGLRMRSLSYPKAWPLNARDQFRKAWTTARQIAGGGAYNPIQIIEMNKVVAEIELRYFTSQEENFNGADPVQQVQR